MVIIFFGLLSLGRRKLKDILKANKGPILLVIDILFVLGYLCIAYFYRRHILLSGLP